VKNYWNSYLKKRVEGGAQGKGAAADPATPAPSDVHGSPDPSENNGQGSVVSRPANSDWSEPAVESSSADDSSCLTATEPAGAGAAVRPHAPVLPKVMFADWLDMDYGTSLVALGPDAGVFDVGGRSPAQGLSHQGSSVQVDGPYGAVDSLHGLGVGGMVLGVRRGGRSVGRAGRRVLRFALHERVPWDQLGRQSVVVFFPTVHPEALCRICFFRRPKCKLCAIPVCS